MISSHELGIPVIDTVVGPGENRYAGALRGALERMDVEVHPWRLEDLLDPEVRQRLACFDALILSGNQGYEPHFSELAGIADICQWLVSGFPGWVFGICRGNHLQVVAHGATLGEYPEHGMKEVLLTAHAAQDPLLHNISSPVVLWQDHSLGINRTGQMNILGTSPDCPVQIMRLEGTHNYGTQGHPELSAQELLINFLRIVRHRGRKF